MACARFPALQGGLHVHEAHKGNCAGLKDLEQIVRILGSHGRHFVLDDAHEFPSCALKTFLCLDDGHIVGEDHGLDVAQHFLEVQTALAKGSEHALELGFHIRVGCGGRGVSQKLCCVFSSHVAQHRGGHEGKAACIDAGLG